MTRMSAEEIFEVHRQRLPDVTEAESKALIAIIAERTDYLSTMLVAYRRGQADASAHETQCPQCAATIRARMADTAERG